MLGIREALEHVYYNAYIAIPNFIQIVSITIFFYYIILHFEDEVAHIWSPKWTWGKAMFLATRYSGALFNILLLVSMIGNFDNLVMRSDGFAVVNLVSKSELSACLYGYLYSGIGLETILLAEGILALRVYAIYNKSKRILCFLVVLLLVSFAVSIAQASGVLTVAVENMGSKFEGIVITPYEPFSVIPFMEASCSFSSQPVSAIAWTITTAVESILFAMVFVKYRRNGPPELNMSSTQGDLLDFLARDSTVYYGLIFACTIIPTIVSFLFETRFSILDDPTPKDVLPTLGYQLNPFQAVVITVMTLLAPQMIINLRRKCYQYTPGDGAGAFVLPGGVSFQSQELSWDARRPPDLNSTIVDTSILDF